MQPAKLLILAAVCLLVPVTASAGADNAKLACKSISTKGGVIHLAGDIPGDLAEFNLSLKRITAETKFTNAADEDIVVVEDFDNKVFTMIVYGKKDRLILYAIPRTVVVIGDRDAAFKVRFSAILSEAPNPSGGDPLSGVRMTCTYEYSV